MMLCTASATIFGNDVLSNTINLHWRMNSQRAHSQASVRLLIIWLNSFVMKGGETHEEDLHKAAGSVLHDGLCWWPVLFGVREKSIVLGPCGACRPRWSELALNTGTPPGARIQSEYIGQWCTTF